MKKIIIPSLILAISNIVLLFFFPWWISIIIAFIVSLLLIDNSFLAFILPFIITSITWLGIILWQEKNYQISVAEVIGDIINQASPIVYLITFVIAGMMSGLGGILAAMIKTPLKSSNN